MLEAQPAEVTPPSGVDGGKYVYCIVRSDRQRDFGAIGIGGGQRVFTVAFKDLAAVVSDTPIVIYDPTRENVLAHEFVNETVMKEFTVIPMSFGTVFRSEDDVTELLRSTYQAFSDVLDKMQDKIEFGLKVLWDREKVIANLERENDEIRRLKDEISRHTTTLDLFRAHAARPTRSRRARGNELALRRRHPRSAQAGRRRQPVEQADRRPDDPQRRVSRRPRAGAGVRRARERDEPEVRRRALLQVLRAMAAVQFRQHQTEIGKGGLTLAPRLSPPVSDGVISLCSPRSPKRRTAPRPHVFAVPTLLALSAAARRAPVCSRFEIGDEQLSLTASAGFDGRRRRVEYRIGERSHPWMVSTLALSPVIERRAAAIGDAHSVRASGRRCRCRGRTIAVPPRSGPTRTPSRCSRRAERGSSRSRIGASAVRRAASSIVDGVLADDMLQEHGVGRDVRGAGAVSRRRAPRRRSKATIARRRSAVAIQQMVDSLPDPVVITDATNDILVQNKRAEHLLFVTEDDSAGRRRAVEMNNLFFSSFLSRATIGGTSTIGDARELNLVDPDEGHDLLFEVLTHPLGERVGPEDAVLSVLRDVTDLRRASRELERQVHARSPGRGRSDRRARSAESHSRERRRSDSRHGQPREHHPDERRGRAAVPRAAPVRAGKLPRVAGGAAERHEVHVVHLGLRADGRADAPRAHDADTSRLGRRAAGGSGVWKNP